MDVLDFVCIVVKEVYKVGVGCVYVDFLDEEMECVYFDYVLDEEFNCFLEWIVKMNDELIECKGVLLMIDVIDFDKFIGILFDCLVIY